MSIQYGPIVRDMNEDPNGLPGQTRGGVKATNQSQAGAYQEYNGSGPSPYPQNSNVPNPLDEATEYPLPPLGPNQ